MGKYLKVLEGAEFEAAPVEAPTEAVGKSADDAPAPVEPTPEAAATPEAEQSASTESAALVTELLIALADAAVIPLRSPIEVDLSLSRIAVVLTHGARILRGTSNPAIREAIARAMKARCMRACELLKAQKVMSADMELSGLKRELTKLAGH
jgi:hypothetical protein